MKQILSILCLLIAALPAFPQQFIGCRKGDNWAETPMLRKTITLTAEDIDSSEIYIDVTSLGYHELYVNGALMGTMDYDEAGREGDHVLQPAVSQLDKRALTVRYDNVAYHLHEGENEIMLWLGQGWGRIYGTPAVAMTDGIVQTDSTWEASPSGYSYTDNWQPMHFGGERYDSRVQPHWHRASVYDAQGIIVSPQQFEGNRIINVRHPFYEYTREADGSLLLHFYFLVNGWFQAEFLPMPAGHKVTIEYLDHLGAKPPFTETDIYIARGSGKEFFTNRFHTHAFRYVRIKGALVDDCQGLHIAAGSTYKRSATFECSDPRLNAIHDMVKFTLSCLTFSGYMVDCPHIERMGYGGDGNSSTMALQTFWDVRDTYRNWLTAWGDAMDTTGDLPYVAPAFRTGGGPYWSGFIIKAPWRTYLNYGDRSLIDEHYDKMVRWLGFVERHCEDGILKPWPDTERRNWFLGDWAVPEGVDKGGESVLHVNNCFLAECLGDMVQMARMTGHPDDAERFAAWRERLLKDIHRHFYHPETHTYANGTVLDQCYALLQGIPQDSATATAVKEQLLADIHGRYRDHIAVGLVGVPVFTEWCIRERQADLMATILRQPDYPGYLYVVENSENYPGAEADSQFSILNAQYPTTWESWDCGRPGKEDRSRVHNCYNGIAIWFYQALAGIRPDNQQPGYEHFFIDPQPVDGITWVKASKPTPHGFIHVEINGNRLSLTVPKGTTATLFPNTPRERTVEAGDWEFEM